MQIQKLNLFIPNSIEENKLLEEIYRIIQK